MILLLGCKDSEEKKAKKKLESWAILLAVSTEINACTYTLDFDTIPVSSLPYIADVSMSGDYAKICSNCYGGNGCAIRVTFPNTGSYRVTLGRSVYKRNCGTTNHTSTVDVIFGEIVYTTTTSTFSITSLGKPGSDSEVITVDVPAGATKGIYGTEKHGFASGGCGGGSFNYSGSKFYNVKLEKID